MTNNPSPQDTNYENSQVFLVVDGSQVVLLHQQVINIGRKSDNHIVIDDEHVSRNHAQIRKIQGQYLLLDLESTVGTSVNGESITQVCLRPGDVISLGGTPIIFGVAPMNAKFKPSDLGAHKRGSAGPTESTDILSADKYLDFFKTPKE